MLHSILTEYTFHILTILSIWQVQKESVNLSNTSGMSDQHKQIPGFHHTNASEWVSGCALTTFSDVYTRVLQAMWRTDRTPAATHLGLVCVCVSCHSLKESSSLQFTQQETLPLRHSLSTFASCAHLPKPEWRSNSIHKLTKEWR